MARFDKSSTKRPKQDAAVAAPRARQALDRAVDRGHDVLPAAAAPRQVDVRLPRGRARRRLRPLRRRSRRHRRRRPLPRRRRLERRAVDLERPEEDRGEPEGRRGLARPVDRPADRRADRARRSTRRSRSSCWRRRTPTRSASSQASTWRSRARSSRQAQIVQLQAAYAGARARTSPARSHRRPGSRSSTTRSAPTINAQSSADDPDARSPRRRAASGEAVAAYKKIVALQPSDPNVQLELAQAAQQAGDTAIGDRRLRGLPQARPGRPECRRS